MTSPNNRTVESDVFCAVRAKDITRTTSHFRESPETADRVVGGWCEMAANLRELEPGSRGTSVVGSRYQATQ
jgi:hypothetical protein